MSSRGATFSGVEWGTAFVGAGIIQTGFALLLIVAGNSKAAIQAQQEVQKEEVPIAVKPILDDAPLLKLGGKKKVRAKLPDMWQKQAPIPQKEFAETSAPSPSAKDDPEEIPTSKVAQGDAEAPPPDAKITPDAESIPVEAGTTTVDASGGPEETTKTGEGDPNGVEQGTTTDPLQASWQKTYRVKIISWFNSRFSPPVGQIPCEELKNLRAVVSANVTPGSRTFTGFTMVSPSGNSIFDGRVNSAMSAITGQQLPPPPPLCTECTVPPTVSVTFSGRTPQCK